MKNRYYNQINKISGEIPPSSTSHKKGKKNKSTTNHEDASPSKRAKTPKEFKRSSSTAEMSQRLNLKPAANSTSDLKLEFSYQCLMESKEEEIEGVLALDLDKTVFNQSYIYGKWQLELPNGKVKMVNGSELVHNPKYAPLMEKAFEDKDEFEKFLFLNIDELIETIIAAQIKHYAVVCITSRGMQSQKGMGDYSAEALITRFNQLIARKTGSKIGITDIYYTGRSDNLEMRYQKSPVLEYLRLKYKLAKNNLILLDDLEKSVKDCMGNLFPAVVYTTNVDKSGKNISLGKVKQFIEGEAPKQIQSPANSKSHFSRQTFAA